jgi:hypothetical protein
VMISGFSTSVQTGLALLRPEYTASMQWTLQRCA